MKRRRFGRTRKKSELNAYMFPYQMMTPGGSESDKTRKPRLGIGNAIVDWVKVEVDHVFYADMSGFGMDFVALQTDSNSVG